MSTTRLAVVIFDTAIVLQGLINSAGPGAIAVGLMAKGVIDVRISPRLRSEYEDVLSRSVVRTKNLHLTDIQMWEGLSRFDNQATMIPNPPRYVNFHRDPKDEHVLNLAIHVNADYLVTRDKDLLDLMDGNLDDGRYFRKHFRNLNIVNPVEFLTIVRELLLPRSE